MIYTMSAAKRLLIKRSINALRVEKLVELKHSYCVVYRIAGIKGRCSTLIGKAAFRQEFVDYRREGALALNGVQLRDNWFKVGNPLNGNVYNVMIGSAIQCECADYQEQQAAIGYGCCKHGYKVLGMLGYASFKDYVAGLGGAIAA